MTELVRDDTRERCAGHHVFDPFTLRSDDHPAFDDARRTLRFQELRRRDTQHAVTDAEKVAQHAAVAVVDHVQAAAVVGADHARGVRTCDVAKAEIARGAHDFRAEARRRHGVPLVDRIADQLVGERVVDDAERAKIGVHIDGSFPARRLRAMRGRNDDERASRERRDREQVQRERQCRARKHVSARHCWLPA